MGKPSDDNPFRSGNTAALDLDKLDKDGNDGWNPWKKGEEKSDWASNDWSGGKVSWPDDFGGAAGGGGGGGSGTAALDISEFEESDSWGGSSSSSSSSSSFGAKKGSGAKKGRFDGFEDFAGFSGGSGTAALDLGDDFLNEHKEEDLSFGKPRTERTEDARDPHTHQSLRGRKSYDGGSGGSDTRKSYDAGKGSSSGLRKANPSNIPAAQDRTAALDIDEIRKAQQKPTPRPPTDHSSDNMARTEAIDVSSLQAGAARLSGSNPSVEVADAFPEESTVAVNLEFANTTGFKRPSSSSLRKVPSGSNVSVKPVKTLMIDQSDIDNFRKQEIDSGACLVIFVPNDTPVPFDLRPGVTNIGRERSNHLVISDPACSRKHLRIKKQGNKFQIRDLTDGNGVNINGKPAPKKEDILLAHGDEIAIGKTVMRFVLGEVTGASTAPPVYQPRGMTAMVEAVPEQNHPRTDAKKPAKQGASMTMIIILVMLILGILCLLGLAVLYFFVLSTDEANAMHGTQDAYALASLLLPHA